MTYLLLTPRNDVAIATWPNYAGQLCPVVPTASVPRSASNLPATKPHITTASTVSLHRDLCAEQH
jgi:hypothetical protein